MSSFNNSSLPPSLFISQAAQLLKKETEVVHYHPVNFCSFVVANSTQTRESQESREPRRLLTTNQYGEVVRRGVVIMAHSSFARIHE